MIQGVAKEDALTRMGDMNDIIAELAIKEKRANAIEDIGKLPSALVSDFSTNGVPLNGQTRSTLVNFGPQLKKLATGLPATQDQFDTTISAFRTQVHKLLETGKAGRGDAAIGARRRKTRKSKKRTTRRR